MPRDEVTVQSSPEFWQSLAMIAGDCPDEYSEAFLPIHKSLGMLALGRFQSNPGHLLLAARRITHGMATLSWFRFFQRQPKALLQWEAEQRFGIGILALRAATDNCGHFLNEFLSLGLDPRAVDVGLPRFRSVVAAVDAQLGKELDEMVTSVAATTRYRHAVAHRAFPRVFLNSETGMLVVPEDPTVLDPIEQWLDRAEGRMRTGVPATDVLGDALALARGCLAASGRACVRKLEATGTKAPRQPTPAEFGAAILRLARSGEYGRADTGGVIHEYMRKARAFYPVDEEAP